MTTKTVLLINNDPNLREVMQACLSHIGGWQVYSIASPLEGLQRAIQEQPDAILFALSTTSISFLTFLKELRNQPKTQTIPVVLIAPGEKWLNFPLLQHYQVLGVIDDLSNPKKFSEQIAKLLDWKEEIFSNSD
ncbi:response regulator [Merismopedia glauca]|uniref:Response regulator n=1 Tax=Merismopedia glauca CCAP 1448/3 TaxID=1296344 RepID=A0A2T1C1I0_9CYAN|nr:response regulator [Merismopedia glauca]PSB01983.1 response regulator [Merismopedia glauca CCAP 1448/3]